jgi:hypothetical protein
MNGSLLRSGSSSSFLAQLFSISDIAHVVQALPNHTFSKLVRHIGVEDAGELVALATTDQLVAAFDEDLFAHSAPGERESFDCQRFVLWLDVLLEAGDNVAADRFASLSEDFVIQALSSLILVFDNEALLARMSLGDDDTFYADKAIESTLSEEIDGYLLLARVPDAWDAVLALVLALDRDHRQLLERILDRCADIGNAYLDDLDELSTLLSEAESLAEDVEGEREDRRNKQGYVEPRSAKHFLTLAKEPFSKQPNQEVRDPITRSYFRDLTRQPAQPNKPPPTPRIAAWVHDIEHSLLEIGHPIVQQPQLASSTSASSLEQRFRTALSHIKEETREELVYLTNVLIAGSTFHGQRFRPSQAAEAVMATVCLGTVLQTTTTSFPPTVEQLQAVLEHSHADLLFRAASSALVIRRTTLAHIGFVYNFNMLNSVLHELHHSSSSGDE